MRVRYLDACSHIPPLRINVSISAQWGDVNGCLYIGYVIALLVAKTNYGTVEVLNTRIKLVVDVKLFFNPIDQGGSA